MLLARAGLLSLAVATFCACSPAKEDIPGPPPPCDRCVTVGSGSTPPDPSGSGGAGGGQGQGGGETATVTGNVETISNSGFDSAFAYTKPALVSADGLSGKQLSADYDGSTFTLDGVASGTTWFRVGPKDTSDTVFPTYSVQQIPGDKLALPVLDQQVLAAIAFQTGLTISTLHAQIVLRVTRGKAALAGVTAASAGAGAILYDVGGDYGAQSAGTNGRGVIVILNQASSSIALKDADDHTYQVDVRPEAGTATLLTLAL